MLRANENAYFEIRRQKSRAILKFSNIFNLSENA